MRELKQLPNLLSLSRILLAALFPLTLAHPWWSFAVLAVAGLTDVLDGWLARRSHRAGALGSAVDAIADKLFVLCIVLALVVSHRLSLVEVLLLATRDIGEVALAARLMAADRPIFGRSANVGGKITTILQYVAIVAVVFHRPFAHGLIVLAGTAGIMATIAYWHRDMHDEDHVHV